MAAMADDMVPSGPGAVLSFLREGAPSALAEVSVSVPAPVHEDHHAEQGLSARCGAFIEWLDQRGFQVVVFDMDRTMSSGHCGQVRSENRLLTFLVPWNPRKAHVLSWPHNPVQFHRGCG